MSETQSRNSDLTEINHRQQTTILNSALGFGILINTVKKMVSPGQMDGLLESTEKLFKQLNAHDVFEATVKNSEQLEGTTMQQAMDFIERKKEQQKAEQEEATKQNNQRIEIEM